MASSEAVSALLEGPECWEDYSTSIEKPIDLTNADLGDRDFSGFTFRNCNMSGIDLDYTNLDKSQFIDCELRHASLEHTSINEAKFVKIDATNCNFTNSILRGTSFTYILFHEANLDNAEFDYCEFSRCEFEKTKINGANFQRVNIDKTIFSNISSEKTVISSSTIQNSSIINSTLDETSFINNDIKRSSLIEVYLNNGKIINSCFLNSSLKLMSLHMMEKTGLDFSHTTIRDSDLDEFDLANSIMLDTTIVQCKWPEQKGNVSLLGRYNKSASLLRQPVQDLKGITPIMRRQIADAQYLQEKHQISTSWIDRLILRLWGMTSSFGQSLSRIVCTACISILASAIVSIIIDDKITATPHIFLTANINTIINECILMGKGFLGFSNPLTLPPTLGQTLMLPISKCMGLITLGLWIGLAANKIGKLSSE
ncbi:MAG: pentapeptide repeat-containing protein [Methylocystaceae bacterium]|nr:pentapeptide repeat-containing protein [Methylocystaceae bacterium]